MKPKCCIFKNVNTYLHVIAVLSLCVVLACWIRECYCKEYRCDVLFLLQDIAYGYLGGYIVYVITILLKNKIERRKCLWQIYDCVEDLYKCVTQYIEIDCGYVAKVNTLGEDENFSNIDEFLDIVDNKIKAFDKYISILTYQDAETISQIRDAIDSIKAIQESALRNKEKNKVLELSGDDNKLIKEQLESLLELTQELHNHYCHKIQKQKPNNKTVDKKRK